MASLNDISGLTERLVAKAQEVHREVEDGDLDFVRLVGLADELGMQADRLASMLQSVNDAFEGRLDSPEKEAEEADGDLSEDLSPSKRGKSGGNGSRSVDQASREELYERAKRMGVPGRSEMSKEELAKAVRGGRRKVKS
jgi:hypothetical protein